MIHTRIMGLGVSVIFSAAILVTQLGCAPLPGIVPLDDTEPGSSVTHGTDNTDDTDGTADTDGTDIAPTIRGKSFVHVGGLMGSLRGQISRGWIAASAMPSHGTLTGSSTRLRIVVGPTETPLPLKR